MGIGRKRSEVEDRKFAFDLMGATHRGAPMNRRSRSQAKKYTEVAQSEESSARLHYRRCHICNHVSEVAGQKVSQCGECGKPMAPFFFFDESEALAPSDIGARPEPKLGDRAPIWGFTAFW
jgi:hypothetical protein